MNRKVLVVDSDPIQRNIVENELTQAGHDVLLAETGAEALAIHSTHEPALSIVEVSLPDRSGTDVCRKMKEARPAGVVLLVSPGIKDIASVADAHVNFGADHYMTKPFQVERLIWKVGELLAGRAVGRLPGTQGADRSVDDQVRFTTEPLAGTQRGTLDEVDPATLVFSFYVHHCSGSLTLIDGMTVRQIVFGAGFPIAADSNARGEEFGQFAVDLGTCDGPDMARIREAWQSIDRHLGVVAVSEGVMGARDLYRTMRLQLEAVLAGALAQSTGEYYLEYGAIPANFDSVSLPSLPVEYVLRGIERSYAADTCRRLLGEWQLVASDHAHFIIRELDEYTELENVLALYGQPVGLPDLRERTGVRPSDALVRTILALRTIGALWVVDDVQAWTVDGGRFARTAELDPGLLGDLDISLSFEGDAQSEDDEPGDSYVALASAAYDPTTQDPQRSAEERYERAVERFGRGDYAAAIIELDGAISRRPDQPGYHVMLGRAILLTPERNPPLIERAISHLKRAIQLDPRQADPHHFLGLALMALDRREEAEFSLRKGIRLGTRHAREAQRLLERL
jgi:CheY-like chemotaxis protein